MEWFDTGIISIMTQSNFSFIDFISGTLNFLDNPIVFVILILLYLLYIKTFYRKNIWLNGHSYIYRQFSFAMEL